MDVSGIADRHSQSSATAIPVLFAADVLTNLTPCICPMIPITAAIARDRNPNRGFSSIPADRQPREH